VAAAERPLPLARERIMNILRAGQAMRAGTENSYN